MTDYEQKARELCLEYEIACVPNIPDFEKLIAQTLKNTAAEIDNSQTARANGRWLKFRPS